MFDNQGDIAGVRIVINSQEFPLYPGSNLKAHETMQPTGLSHNEGDWGLTVYFKDPTEICSAHRRAQGGSVGDRLWVAKANEPSGFLKVPIYHSEDELFNGRWKASACAPAGFAFPGSPGMGLHYWSMDDRQGNTDCAEGEPVFFLYDKGRLQGSGIEISGFDYKLPTLGNVRPAAWEIPHAYLAPPGSELVEFPRQPLDPYLFRREESFKCNKNLNAFDTSDQGDVTVATLHVMFQDWFEITCEGHEDRIVNHTMGHALHVV